MKINDKEKGINHNLFGWSDDDVNDYYDNLATEELPPLTDTDDVLEMIKRNEQAQVEWEKQGELNIKTLLAKQKPLVESFKKKQAIATSKKQKINYDGDSFIGDQKFPTQIYQRVAFAVRKITTKNYRGSLC